MFIAIAIIAIAIITTLIIQYNTCPSCSTGIVLNIADISVKTGDIVLCKYPFFETSDVSAWQTACMMFLKVYNCVTTSYTHTGIIVMLNNIPYVLHIDDKLAYDHHSQKDVCSKPRVVPLSEMAQTCLIHIHPLKDSVPHPYNIDNAINKISHKTYETSAIKNILCGFLKLRTHGNDSFVCTDLVEEVLTELGTLPNYTKNANLSDTLKLIKQYCKQPAYLISTI